MVDVATAVVFASALVASLFMAWTIGAGSAGSTPFAPAVGAKAIPVMRAGFVVGICILLGAVLQGANVSEAVGRELVGGVTLTPEAAAIALVIAATLVTIGVFTGYPIATAFTVTGAVIGVGLALGGVPNWPKWAEIAALWTLTPLIGGSLSYLIVRWLHGEATSTAATITVLGGVVGLLLANIEFALLGPDDGAATIADTAMAVAPGPAALAWAGTSLAFALAGALLVGRQVRRDLTRGQQRFTLVMGAIVAFSAGGSQVGLAVGPLLPMLEDAVPLLAILLGGGIGLLVGAWTGAPRMIKAVSQDYALMGPGRAIAALVPAFAIAQVAILFGIPVSFNEIIVSGVVGSGFAATDAGGKVDPHKIGYTVLAWAASFVAAVVVGFAVVSAVEFVL